MNEEQIKDYQKMEDKIDVGAIIQNNNNYESLILALIAWIKEQ